MGSVTGLVVVDGLFKLHNSVTITGLLTGGTFDLFDGNYVHTHSPINIGKGTARCGRTYSTQHQRYHPLILRNSYGGRIVRCGWTFNPSCATTYSFHNSI